MDPKIFFQHINMETAGLSVCSAVTKETIFQTGDIYGRRRTASAESFCKLADISHSQPDTNLDTDLTEN